MVTVVGMKERAVEAPAELACPLGSSARESAQPVVRLAVPRWSSPCCRFLRRATSSSGVRPPPEVLKGTSNDPFVAAIQSRTLRFHEGVYR